MPHSAVLGSQMLRPTLIRDLCSPIPELSSQLPGCPGTHMDKARGLPCQILRCREVCRWDARYRTCRSPNADPKAHPKAHTEYGVGDGLELQDSGRHTPH